VVREYNVLVVKGAMLQVDLFWNNFLASRLFILDEGSKEHGRG